MSDTYTGGEVRQILSEVRRGASFEELHCPRDRHVLRVFFSEFRPHVANDPVQGARCDESGDVTEIRVECPVCGARRARASLRRK